MSQLTRIHPSHLEEPMNRVLAVYNLTKKLDFLDQICKDRIADCLQEKEQGEAKNGLFEMMATRKYFYLFDTSKKLPNDITHQDILDYSPQLSIRDYQKLSPFFTNATNCCVDPPEDALVLRGIYFHTFKCAKHDTLDNQKLLEEQIKWTIPTNENSEDNDGSIMADIYQHLSQYDDFWGLYCTYSGNKSVHIHTAWGMEDMQIFFLYPSLPDYVYGERLRNGLIRHWDMMSDEILQIITKRTGKKFNFDSGLRAPDAFRRLSWGLRSVEKDAEFFDIGAKVLQVELWSAHQELNIPKFNRENRYAYYDNCFHKPHIFLGLSHSDTEMLLQNILQEMRNACNW